MRREHPPGLCLEVFLRRSELEATRFRRMRLTILLSFEIFARHSQDASRERYADHQARNPAPLSVATASGRAAANSKDAAISIDGAPSEIRVELYELRPLRSQTRGCRSGVNNAVTKMVLEWKRSNLRDDGKLLKPYRHVRSKLL